MVDIVREEGLDSVLQAGRVRELHKEICSLESSAFMTPFEWKSLTLHLKKEVLVSHTGEN